MPKYHVHLYPTVRVTVRDVEAESQVEAIKRAEALVDLHHLFAKLDSPSIDVAYDGELEGFLVDEVDDVKHAWFMCYDSNYEPMWVRPAR